MSTFSIHLFSPSILILLMQKHNNPYSSLADRISLEHWAGGKAEQAKNKIFSESGIERRLEFLISMNLMSMALAWHMGFFLLWLFHKQCFLASLPLNWKFLEAICSEMFLKYLVEFMADKPAFKYL